MIRADWTLLVLLSLLGCGAPQSLPSHTRLAPPSVRITKLTEDFAFGVKMTFLDDGRLLITEKETGRVRLVTATFALEPQPVLDVAVNYAGERGLLGVAAHPDFARNGYVYIAYVASATSQDTNEREGVSNMRVARFRLTGTVADGAPQTLITLPARPGPYHTGGCLLFGPDGKLYVSLGELNRHANLNSQVTGKLQGKILRYNDNGSIPPDNPLGAGNPIYIYGIRNVFGFAFDSQSPEVFVSDNGPSGYDRLTKAAPGDNLGWPLIWGTVNTWYERLAAWWLGKSFRQAFWESFREHAVPTAVQVVPNDLYGPTLRGRVLMSAFGLGQVLQFALDNTTHSTAVGIGPFVEGLPNIVDLQFGADGHLYVLTIRALYRIDPVSDP